MRGLWMAAVCLAMAALLSGADVVGRFDPLDIPLASDRSWENPWRDVQVSATLTSPAGRSREVRGFHEGSGRWVIRISLDETGMWRVATHSNPPYPEFATNRQVEVTPSGRSGPLRLDPARSGFSHADGSPFFLVGDTCYPLLGLDRESQFLPYLRTRRGQGFTLIRWQAAMVEPRFPQLWPWGGTREKPDLDRFNPDYFRNMDRVVRDLRAQGLQTEVILLNFYPTGGVMRDPTVWTEARERAWLAYLVARYGAFDNVAYWTVANEFENRPDGAYRLDEPADIDWARRTAGYIKSVDPYHHPVTIHPYSRYEKYLEMFGRAPEIDILTLQEHGAETKQARHLSDGDGAGLEEKVRRARASGKVVVAAEFGYEWDGVTLRGSNTSSDLLRKQAWRIVMGGGHFSAGFRSTVFNFAEIAFDVTNGKRPGAQYVATLAHFFQEKTQFWNLRPEAGLCLRGDQELVVYAPNGGPVRANLSDYKGLFTVRWLNPVTGEERDGGELEGGAERQLTAPWGEAVLHVESAVRVEAPRDGGWPRDPERIRRVAANRFTVDPDGHERYVTVDVVNSAAHPQEVALGGFLMNFGRVRSSKQFSAEQYLYVRFAEGPWRRMYRTGSELVMQVPPGRTRVSTVVPFSYQEYVDYVESLQDPRVHKEVVLTSSAGAFRVYRIRITNPGGHDKLRVALNRTNHAYERSGFYVTQGAIAWLLSGDPAANLDAIEWTIYPTLDPQAIHDGQDYTEYDSLLLDNGRKQRDALWNPVSGELPAAHYHVLTDLHMWESRDWESYKYNDPYAAKGTAGNGKSEVERVLLGFWPYWYEFGIDAWDHENKWQSANALTKNFGGALTTHLELPFYGKDDIDPRERMREQGRLLARAHSQAFLRMQREHHYWKSVDSSHAILLPVPETILAESLTPSAGTPRGGTMSLYHETYEHGIGMKAGEAVSYMLPEGIDTFRAMVGVDDAETGDSPVQFVVELSGKEVWRSGRLRRFDRQLVFLNVRRGGNLTLRVEGERGVLANWGGAKFTRHDAEKSFSATDGRE